MISEVFAAEQIERLSGLNYFPTKEVALDELISALRTVTAGEEDAKEFVDSWIEVNSHAPTPADLYELAARRAAKTDFFDPNEHPCEACGGTSWTVLIGPVPEHLATAKSLGVVRCHCFQSKAVSA